MTFNKRAGYASNLKKSGTRINEFSSPLSATPSDIMTAQGEESKTKTTVKLPKKNHITVIRKKDKVKTKESSPNISPFGGKGRSGPIKPDGFGAELAGNTQKKKFANVKVYTVNSFADLTDEEQLVVRSQPGLSRAPKTIMAKAVAKRLTSELQLLEEPLSKAYFTIKG